MQKPGDDVWPCLTLLALWKNMLKNWNLEYMKIEFKNLLEKAWKRKRNKINQWGTLSSSKKRLRTEGAYASCLKHKQRPWVLKAESHLFLLLTWILTELCTAFPSSIRQGKKTKNQMKNGHPKIIQRRPFMANVFYILTHLRYGQCSGVKFIDSMSNVSFTTSSWKG